MVEIFKTNVESPEDAALIVAQLLLQTPQFRINFDLDDCDRILRVEGKVILPHYIITTCAAYWNSCA